MMLKNYMLIIFQSKNWFRSMTNTPPLQRALKLHGECKTITEIEIYKYLPIQKDYKYLCTIKFDRDLLNE